MRKVIVWNLVSLDGYFEGSKPWEIDFHGLVWGDELEKLSIEQGEDAAMLVFGRKTYQGMADYWQTATENEVIARFMNATPKIVASRTLDEATWNNTRLISTGIEQEIARLRKEDGKNIYIFGSADLTAFLAAHDLIDEYRLCVCPVLLGQGNPMFKQAEQSRNLQLLNVQPLTTGGVILRYAPER